MSDDPNATEATDAKFTCPRRVEDGMDSGPFVHAGTNIDTWNPPRGHAGIDGGGLGDKHRTCSYCGSLRPDDLFAAIDAGVQCDATDKNYKLYVGRSSSDAVYGKFYFQHLSIDERQRYVELLYAGKTNPGFYVLPFFIGRGGK